MIESFTHKIKKIWRGWFGEEPEPLPEQRIKSLITALQGMGLDPTADELADALWLAMQVMPFADRETEPLDTKPGKEPAPSVSGDAGGPEIKLRKRLIKVRRKKPVSPLYAGKEGKTASLRGGSLSLRTPAAPMLPDARNLERALRPVKQKGPSRTRYVLDESATVHQIAEQGLWSPVLRAMPERRFDLALVTDQSPSMVIWQPLIAEFRALVERVGAFRDLRTYELLPNPDPECKNGVKRRNGAERNFCKIQLRPGLGGSEDSRNCDPKELLDPTGRRVILVISDCVSPAWYDGSVIKWLKMWGERHPTAIVQMLPQRLWSGTALGADIRVNLRSLEPGPPNSRLKDDYADLWFDDEYQPGLRMPVLTLEPESLGLWASVTAGGAAWVSGVIFRDRRHQASRKKVSDDSAARAEESEAPVEALTAEERVRNFYATASSTAQHLAGYLAAAPLTLPVMRLIQQVMLPGSRQVHLAEFFLGGLIRRISPLEKDPNLNEYNFHKHVREILLDSTLMPDALQVLETVSKYLEDRMGQSLDFQAWLANPGKIRAEMIDDAARPFAMISATVLRRLGGEYAELADRLEGETVTPKKGTEKEAIESEAVSEVAELETITEEYQERFTNSLGMEFVFIPPGEFMMGSPEDEPERDDDETLHKVILTRGFYMQTTQVTVGQWREFVQNTGFKTQAETEDGAYGWTGSDFEKRKEFYWDNPGFAQEDTHPVTCVSWNDAQAFIEWMNQRKGPDRYRLPTEAEWEYSCRAGTATPFFFGDCLSTDEANYDGNYPLEGCPKGEYRGKTTPVASFPANDWGLYDMHGNVYEWCQDWFGDYPTDTVTDPVGPGSGSDRVARGGGWFSYARRCRSASRGRSTPGIRPINLGLRLVSSPGQQ